MIGIEQGNWQHVGQLLATSANRLAAVGAQFAICPDNTVHQAFDEAVVASSIPWLHIAAVVAQEATHRRFSCIGILGTRYLMEGPVYQEALARTEVKMMLPKPVDRRRINSYIFDELVYDRFTDSTRRYFVQVIQDLQQDGCQAVVLGCTEIPLLIRPEDSPLPTLDSTRLLARAALNRALEPER
jgi:aspartate racemase